MSKKKPKVKKEEKIDAFLTLFKDTSRNYKMVSFIPRTGLNKNLSSLEIDQDQAKKFLSKLSFKNYVRGPLDDDDKERIDKEQGNIWIFGCDVHGKEAYIKLKIATSKEDKTIVVAKVLSFHLSTDKLDFPYKKD